MRITSEAATREIAIQLSDQAAQSMLSAPWWYKAGALVLSWANALWQNVFGGAWMIAVLLTIIDWREGRRAARAQGAFNPAISTHGWNAKLTALLLLVVVRVIEIWVHHQGAQLISFLGGLENVLPEGSIATFFSVLVWKDQWDSINRHLAAQGHAPTFSRIAGIMFDDIMNRIVPGRKRGADDSPEPKP